MGGSEGGYEGEREAGKDKVWAASLTIAVVRASAKPRPRMLRCELSAARKMRRSASPCSCAAFCCAASCRFAASRCSCDCAVCC